jgi:hypothetical protein
MCSDRFWGPPRLPFDEFRMIFPEGESGSCSKMTASLYLLPSLKMSGALSPLSHVLLACTWTSLPNYSIILRCTIWGSDIRGGAVGWGNSLQAGRSQVWFPMESLESFTDWIVPAALWPWVDSASNRNEYLEYFLESKGGRCLGLTTLPPSCADCLEIWEPQTPGNIGDCQGLCRDSFYKYRLFNVLLYYLIPIVWLFLCWQRGKY